jgi:hypothetical protein
MREFSVVTGGPLFHIYRRAHLSGEALQLANRRMVCVVALVWVPLLVLSVLEGNAWSGVREPFLLDAELHARLLIALPLMVGGERLLHRLMCVAVREFTECGLIPAGSLVRFEAAVTSARRLKDSRLAELVILLLVYTIGVGLLWRDLIALHIDTWYRKLPDGVPHVTLAGWWYGLVSLPLFQFILFRWYYRLGIWAWLLWKVTRTRLALVPTHPDRCGGLGFLGEFTWALAPLLLAHGVLLAGVAASGIFFDERILTQYWPALLLLAMLIFCIVLGPLLTFIPVLVRTKQVGLREYGALAQAYVRQFDTKWLREIAPSDPLLGSSDIQSLADMGNSYAVIADMRPLPVSRAVIVGLSLVTVAPIAPLILTLISIHQLLALLLKGLG